MSRCPNLGANGAAAEVSDTLSSLREQMESATGTASSIMSSLASFVPPAPFIPPGPIPPFDVQIPITAPGEPELPNFDPPPSFSGHYGGVNLDSLASPSAPSAPDLSVNVESTLNDRLAGARIAPRHGNWNPAAPAAATAAFGGSAPEKLEVGELNPATPSCGSATVRAPAAPPSAPAITPRALTAPSNPARPLLDYRDPTAIARADLEPIDATVTDPQARPAWTEPMPQYDFSGAPGVAPHNWVGPAPGKTPLDIPRYDGPGAPPEPSLLTVPTVMVRDPTIAPLSIDVLLPLTELPTLEGTIHYVDPGYADTQLAQLEAEISRVLNGNLGIPDYLWDAIWDKAGTQLHRQAVTLERQARRAWAKLGWMLPGGMALAGREQAAHDINEQVSEKARELAIQRATMEREDFWQAVQHGTALQQLEIGLYNAQQERLFKLAVSQVEVFVAVYNALLTKHQMQVQQVQAQLATEELKLKHALATLEVDKTKLEAAKLVGEINQVAVQTYVARWEAVKTAIEKYRVEMTKVDYQLKDRELDLQRYAEQTKGWATEVDAWGKEWDGYVAKLKAQETKATTYEAAARVFGERMKGYGISVEADKARIEAEVSAQTLKLEHMKVDTQRYVAEWQGVQTLLEQQTKLFGIDAQKYATDADLAKAVVQFDTEYQKLGQASHEQLLQKYRIDMEGAVAELNAQMQAFGHATQLAAAELSAQAQAMQARASMQSAYNGAYAADVQKYQADIQLSLGNVDAAVRALQANAQIAAAELGYYGDLAGAEASVIGHQASVSGHEAQVIAARLQQASQQLSAAAQMFGAKVQAFAAEVELEKARAGQNQAAAQLEISAFQAEVEGYRAEVQAFAASASAAASVAQAHVQKFSAMGQISIAQSQVAASIAQMHHSANVAAANHSLAAAQVTASTSLAQAELQAKALEGAGSVAAQIAAGAMAGMNVSASISSTYSKGESTSCSTTYNGDD